MFNFEFTDPREKAAQKPMRSYITVDASGKAEAKIFADEYDAVRNHPDFQKFKIRSDATMEGEQAIEDAARKAKMQAIKARLAEATTEQVEADLALAEAQGTNDADDKTGLFGLFGPTYKQQAERARGKTESVRQLMDSEFPEFSARKTAAPVEPVALPREQPATPTPQAMPAVPSGFTQRQGQVRIWNPKTSRFEYVPASDLS